MWLYLSGLALSIWQHFHPFASQPSLLTRADHKWYCSMSPRHTAGYVTCSSLTVHRTVHSSLRSCVSYIVDHRPVTQSIGTVLKEFFMFFMDHPRSDPNLVCSQVKTLTVFTSLACSQLLQINCMLRLVRSKWKQLNMCDQSATIILCLHAGRIIEL